MFAVITDSFFFLSWQKTNGNQVKVLKNQNNSKNTILL